MCFSSKPIIFSSPTRIIRGHCRGASAYFFRTYILDFVILHPSWGFHIQLLCLQGTAVPSKQEVGRTVLREVHLSGVRLQEWMRIICKWFSTFHSPNSQCPIPQSAEVAVASCSLEHPSWLFFTLCLPASPFLVLWYMITLFQRKQEKHLSSPSSKKDADLHLTGALQLPMEWFAPFSILADKWQVNKAPSLEEAGDYL